MTITPWNRIDKQDDDSSWPITPQRQRFDNLSDTLIEQPSNTSQQEHSKNKSADAGTSDKTQLSASGLMPQSYLSGGDPLLGTVFMDTYTIEQTIGKGGMGTVYLVTEISSGRQLALKLLHQQGMEDPNVMRRFRQEGKAVARVHHRNINEVLDYGTSPDGRPFLVSPYLGSLTLSKKLRESQGKLPILEALGIFIQICDGLESVHERGIIHRDIKPSNIMIVEGTRGNEDIVKIVDFGIAKVFPHLNETKLNDTTTGDIFGTPLYMSPEQCTGKPVSSASDVYAVGCLMYEIISGKPPFAADSHASTMFMHVTGPIPHLVNVQKEDQSIVDSMDIIISKALAKRPDQRYQTMGELSDALRSVIRDSHGINRVILKLKRKLVAVNELCRRASDKRWVVATVGCIVTALLCALGVPVYLVATVPDLSTKQLEFKQPTSQTATDKSAFEREESQFNQRLKLIGPDAGIAKLQWLRRFGDFYRFSGNYPQALLKYQLADMVARELHLGVTDEYPIAKIDSRDVATWAAITSQVSMPNTTATELSKIYTGIAECLLSENQPIPASNFGLYAQILLNQAQDFFSVDALAARFALAKAYAARGEAKAALEHYKWCLANYGYDIDETHNTAVEKNSAVAVANNSARRLECATCVSEFADFAYQQNDLRLSRKLLEIAASLWQKLGPEYEYNFAVSQNKLAIIAERNKDYEQSKIFFNKALESLGRLDAFPQMAKVEISLADLEWQQHKFVDALCARVRAKLDLMQKHND